MRLSDHLICLLRNLYVGQEATVRTEHGTTDWFKTGKGDDKAAYCHFAYLTYMQSTSWEMQCWMITSWIQDCQEKYQQPQLCKWCQSNGRKWREIKKPLDDGERGDWKSWLKLHIQKTSIMAFIPITSWEIEREKLQTVTVFFSWAPKSPQTVTEAMKLKDTCSLEEKLWQN